MNVKSHSAGSYSVPALYKAMGVSSRASSTRVGLCRARSHLGASGNESQGRTSDCDGDCHRITQLCGGVAMGRFLLMEEVLNRLWKENF